MTFRYVPHHQVHDSLLLGWMPTPALNGTIYGLWSVLMKWPCECTAPIPKDASE